MPSTVADPASFRGVLRAWLVVVGLFVILMGSAGLGFYGLSVYLSVLSEQRGFTVSALSGAVAVFFLVSGASGIVCARLLQRIDPRVIVTAGAAIAAAALVGLGRVTRLAEIYGAYALFGAGYAGTSFIVSTTLVTRWFDHKRAVALSLSSTGVSVGGIALTPIARHLLDAHPLDAATLRIAALYVVCIVPAALAFVRPDPARFGLGPDGAPRRIRADGMAQVGRGGMSFADAIGSKVFFGLTATFLLALGAQVGAISQLDKVAHERLADGTASRMVSILAAGAVIGRLAGSAVSGRFSPRRFTATMISLQAGAIVVMAVSRNAVSFTAGTAVFGLALSNVLLLHPLLLASAFGVRDYPRIYGRSQAITTLGIAGGPFLYGWLRDHAGGYTTSYLAGALMTGAALAAYLRYGDVAGPRATELDRATDVDRVLSR